MCLFRLMPTLEGVSFRLLQVLNRQKTDFETKNTKLMAKIKELHRLYNGILGYRRMTTFINRQLGTT